MNVENKVSQPKIKPKSFYEGKVTTNPRTVYSSRPTAQPRFGHNACSFDELVVIFGGAVGDAGRYRITDETLFFDKVNLRWRFPDIKLKPSPRAAHAMCGVNNNKVLVHGGAAGGGALSSEEVFCLDLENLDNMIWVVIPVLGVSPGKRYGHTMVYMKPNVFMFGGHDGIRCYDDLWTLECENYQWNYIDISSTRPSSRVYHSADGCQEGPAKSMMVIFGGRSDAGFATSDIWGLRKHRDGQYDWVKAPIKQGPVPLARFQHISLFIEKWFIVIGGRDGDTNQALNTSVYNTEMCQWRNYPPMARFRHCAWVYNKEVYCYGGFDNILQTAPKVDLEVFTLSSKHKFNLFLDDENFINSNLLDRNICQTPVKHNQLSSHDQVRISTNVLASCDSGEYRNIPIDQLPEEGRKIKGHGLTEVYKVNTSQLANKILSKMLRPNISQQLIQRDFNMVSQFCLSESECLELCRSVRPILQNEKMILELQAPIKIYGDIHGQYYDLMRLFQSYKCPVHEEWAEVNNMTQYDIEGDIDSIDYLFLGDYVDRGTNSLEVLCLLLAFKCLYPNQIHLIRGNHEDEAINAVYGFKEECQRRIRDDTNDHCYAAFNDLFENMPVAAVINNKVLCIHGGIGCSINSLDDIRSLKRPLKVNQQPESQQDQFVTDLLWSDPTDNDSLCGIVNNTTRDPEGTGHIVKFGPDRVIKFLKSNNLQLIIRAHECVMDGFERFAGGKLITVFSATDYCGTNRNAGALLFLRRDLTIVPKVIFPKDRLVRRDGYWLQLERPSTPPRDIARYLQQ